MKKFLPLLAVLLVACATVNPAQIGPVEYAVPNGWSVSGAGGNIDGFKQSDSVVYVKGMNKLAISILYSEKPFDINDILEATKNSSNKINGNAVLHNPQTTNPEIARMENVASVELDLSLEQSGAFLVTKTFGAAYNNDGKTNAVVVSYIGVSDKSYHAAESDIGSYYDTVRSLRFQ